MVLGSGPIILMWTVSDNRPGVISSVGLTQIRSGRCLERGLSTGRQDSPSGAAIPDTPATYKYRWIKFRNRGFALRSSLRLPTFAYGPQG